MGAPCRPYGRCCTPRRPPSRPPTGFGRHQRPRQRWTGRCDRRDGAGVIQLLSGRPDENPGANGLVWTVTPSRPGGVAAPARASKALSSRPRPRRTSRVGRSIGSGGDGLRLAPGPGGVAEGASANSSSEVVRRHLDVDVGPFLLQEHGHPGVPFAPSLVPGPRSYPPASYSDSRIGTPDFAPRAVARLTSLWARARANAGRSKL